MATNMDTFATDYPSTALEAAVLGQALCFFGIGRSGREDRRTGAAGFHGFVYTQQTVRYGKFKELT